MGAILAPLLYAQSDSLAVIRFLQKEVRRLTAFRGRGHGTADAARTVRYITQRFRKMGYGVRVDTFPLSVYRLTEARVWVSADGRRWQKLRLGHDFVPAGFSKPIEGRWRVDTSAPQPDAAWLTHMPLSQALRQARQGGAALLLLPQSKLIATVATASIAPSVIYIRDTLPVPAFVKVQLRGRLIQTIGWNVSAHLKGQKSDSAWVIGAHYDHLGRIGRATFWGANDNASGVACLLALADRMKKAPTPPYDVWFVAFGAEELGLVGSQAWVQRPPYPLQRLRGMLNFDLMGFGEKGLAVVGGADQPDFWQRIDSLRKACGWDPPLLLRPNAPNSDHYPFREKGVPALFFYLEGGPGYYHDIYDRPGTLTWVGAYPFLRWMQTLLQMP